MAAKKILLVDDSMINIAQTRSLLSRTNCMVITAVNGKEALEKTRDERPGLILMDLYMPEMNGDECCRIIKSDESLKDIPVIIYTVAKGREERQRCLLAGCDDYLTRPVIDTDDLLKKIKKFLDIPLREDMRVSIDTPVRYFHEGRDYSGRLVNVSTSGGFIETIIPLPSGAVITLSFDIPNTANHVEAAAEIVRTIASPKDNPTTRIIPGMGVRFLGITWSGSRIIADYVAEKINKRLTVA